MSQVRAAPGKIWGVEREITIKIKIKTSNQGASLNLNLARNRNLRFPFHGKRTWAVTRAGAQCVRLSGRRRRLPTLRKQILLARSRARSYYRKNRRPRTIFHDSFLQLASQVGGDCLPGG